MAQKVTGIIKLQINAAKATASPPVGPALGQHGVNTAVAVATAEFHLAIYESIESVVFTHTYILTRIVNCTTLANDDVASDAVLTTPNLNT